ncbi:MAG: DUF2066 domain-containing protein [Rickettsiales bacterium]|jgi:hypothetical protein|nr:DUF2066 domain-containing protein [Rickettsiales bacterium]
MRNITFITIILLSFLSQQASFAAERSEEDFIIRDIKISEVGIDSEAARQKAVIMAQSQAFEILVDNLIGSQFDIEVDSSEIETLIESIEIKDEVITNQNYAAIFSVYFNQSYTTYFLDRKIIAAKEHVPSVLLVPVMNENGYFKLWQYGNIWRIALANTTPKTVLDIKIPSGDIDDLENFVVENFASYGQDSIEQLKRNYAVEKIIIATVFYEYNNDYSNVNLSLHLGELGTIENRALLASKSIAPEDSIRDQLDEYAYLLYTKLDEAWVNFSTLSISAQRNEQLVVFEISRAQDLQKVYADLAQLDYIASWSLASLSTRYAGFRLLFDQSPLELIESLKESGYNISRNGEHLFVIGGK